MFAHSRVVCVRSTCARPQRSHACGAVSTVTRSVLACDVYWQVRSSDSAETTRACAPAPAPATIRAHGLACFATGLDAAAPPHPASAIVPSTAKWTRTRMLRGYCRRGVHGTDTRT